MRPSALSLAVPCLWAAACAGAPAPSPGLPVPEDGIAVDLLDRVGDPFVLEDVQVTLDRAPQPPRRAEGRDLRIAVLPRLARGDHVLEVQARAVVRCGLIGSAGLHLRLQARKELRVAPGAGAARGWIGVRLEVRPGETIPFERRLAVRFSARGVTLDPPWDLFAGRGDADACAAKPPLGRASCWFDAAIAAAEARRNRVGLECLRAKRAILTELTADPPEASAPISPEKGASLLLAEGERCAPDDRMPHLDALVSVERDDCAALGE